MIGRTGEENSEFTNQYELWVAEPTGRREKILISLNDDGTRFAVSSTADSDDTPGDKAAYSKESTYLLNLSSLSK